MSGAVKRDLRGQRRAQTEARVIASATELFVADGYTATTLADVAAHANVGERTVYLRFATKADLLHRCLDVAIGGDADPIAVAERNWMAEAMTAATRSERIRLMARATAGLMERTGPLLAVAHQAAATEPAIADLAQAGRKETQHTLDRFWRNMDADGLLPRGCDLDWLADTATALAQADTYLLLARTVGWDIATYESWLTTTWDRMVEASAITVA